RACRRVHRIAESIGGAFDLRAAGELHPEPLFAGVVLRAHEHRPRRQRAPQPFPVGADEEEAAILRDAVGAELDLLWMHEAEGLDRRDRDPRDRSHWASYMPNSSRSTLQISPIVQRAASASRSGGSRFSGPCAASR